MNLFLLLGLIFGPGVDAAKKFRIKTYRVSVNVQDRYVRTEVAVQVKNNLGTTEQYEFGVKLDETEFISSMTMRVGKHNKYYYGQVHEQNTAAQIFQQAVSQGNNAGLVQQQKDPLKDTTFSALVSIPAGEEAFFWLTYEQQLDRREGKYKYKTNIRPYEPVDVLQVKVNIVESRDIIGRKTESNFGTGSTRSLGMTETINSSKSRSYVFESRNDPNEFQETVYVTYDVDRPQLDGGDILVRDGYFVHFISPENLPPIAKNIVFVIDTSGSMSAYGRMDRLKQAFNYIINDLNAGDHFQIIEFNYWGKTIYSSFQAVTPSTQADAIARVNGLRPGGLTNIDHAMQLALGQRNNNDAANIIVFITDGYPTTGATYWPTIRDNVNRNNPKNYAIFTLAIGTHAPYLDMERLSTLHNGVARQVFDGVEVTSQIQDFYDGVATPLVWNAKLSYQNAKAAVLNNGNLFAGQEMVILGKLEDPCKAPVPVCNDKLIASSANLCQDTSALEVDCSPRPTVPPFDPNDSSRDKMENPTMPLGSNIDLEKYYNYLKMQGKLAIYKVTDDDAERDVMKQDITDAAVDQGFVTRFTSMVVVEGSSQTRSHMRVRVKHTQEWKDELEELFMDKAVKDMITKEEKRLAEYEQSRRRRSSDMSPLGGAAPLRNLMWIFPLIGLSLAWRFKRSFASPIRVFSRL